jgi:hypothetical protein
MNLNNPLDALNNLPKAYNFPRFNRIASIIMAGLVIIYSLMVVFFSINDQSTTAQKVIPFILLFLSFNLLIKGLFSLNTVLIEDDAVTFKYILKKNIKIPWLRLQKIEMYKGRPKSFILTYTENSQEKKYMLTMQFPNLIEIINIIAYLAPHTENDKFVASLLIPIEEKEN